MDPTSKQQIDNILKNNKFDPTLFKYIKMKENTYKMCYNNILVTYIEVFNKSNKPAQAMNWKPSKKDIIGYIKKLEKFTIDVVTIIDIVDSGDTFSRCIDSLKNQSNKPYIILIVSTHHEKQLAINYDIDFFWCTERSQYQRFNSCLRFVRGNFKFVNSVMLCNSNDVFLKGWITGGVKLIKGGSLICGKPYNYVVDKEVGLLYRRNVDQAYGSKVIHYTPFVNMVWFNGIIINKVLLNKVSWDISSSTFRNSITFGIFDNLMKHIDKVGTINSSDVVTIFSDTSIISINSFIMDRGSKVEPIPKLPVLNEYPIKDLDIAVKPSKRRKVFAKNRTKKPEPVKSASDEIPKKYTRPAPNLKKKITKKAEKKRNDVNIPKINRRAIEQKKKNDENRKKKRDIYKTILDNLRLEKETTLDIPKIIKKKVQEIQKDRGSRYVVPPERAEKPTVLIPQIILKKHEEPPKKQQRGQIVIPPERLPVPSIDIPMILSNNLLRESRANRSIDMNIVVEKNRVPHMSLTSKLRLITLILVNGNLNSVEMCVEYLRNQTVKTDIILILENIRQKEVADKLKIPYFIFDTPNEHIRIQNSLKHVRNLNPNYICFVEDTTCLSCTWIEECVEKIKSGIDVVGGRKLYLYNGNESNKFRIELITENLNFIGRHYRKVWSFFAGRTMSKKLLDKLNWHLFSSNYDVDIEVSLGIKLTMVGAKLCNIDSVALNYINRRKLDYYQNVNYINLQKLEHKTDEVKSLHETFDKLLGPYKIINIPMIQAKHQVVLQRKPVVRKKIKKTFGNDSYEVTVSIVLPTLNGLPHIKTVIKCIKNQTFKDYELVIVNDGSTQEGFKEYLNSITCHKIKVIHLQKNIGLPGALNTGLKNSKGKYWTWISDDNLINDNFLYKLKHKLDENYGFVYSNYKLIDSLSPGSPTVNMKIKYSNVNDVIDCWRGMPSYMWRRELIDQIGFFDETIQGCEDFEFVIKTFIGCGDAIAHIDDCLFSYFKRFNTLTTRLRNEIPKLKEETRRKYKFAVYLQELHDIVYSTNKEIMIYLSDVDYYKLFQRPQQFMKLLSRKYECIFVSRMKDVDIKNENGVWVINKDLFDLYKINFNLSARNITLYYNDPKFYPYIQQLHPQCTIFDLIDNPVEEFAEWNKYLKTAVEMADIVTYSSAYLEGILKKVNAEKPLYYVGNGCDFDHFNKATKPIHPKPKEMKDLPSKPILGYYGALTSWIDFGLVRKIADLDCVHVVMIGGIQEISQFNMKFKHKNITWIPHVPYKDLPRYLSWFSFCMIPFKQTEMIKGCNPIKFYEYYAAGKIVIGADFKDINCFYYKIDHTNYEVTVRNIIKNCDLRVPRKDYIRYARENSWGNHMKALVSAIRIDYTIIYPPLIKYDFLMQRPAQLMRSFGKTDRIRSIFVERDHHSAEKKTYKFMILNKSTFNNRIKYFIKGKLIFYYTFPNHINYKNKLRPDYTIFDLIDNPTDEFKNWYNENLFRSIKESDLFICSAPVMYNKFKNMNRNSILISNGCDFNHFMWAHHKQNIPRKFTSLIKNRIVIGYYGAHASWVDFNLIRKIANHKPTLYTVVMIGKSAVYDNSFHHSNITWIDHQSYEDLPKFLSWFDICIVPFKLTEMIRGCDPIKFYEYSAAGKPVVATAMEPLKAYKDICYFMNHVNYGRIIDLAAKQRSKPHLVKERRKIAQEHSWDIKANGILNNLISHDIHTTILYPPYVSWNKMYQRPQQMITALSKKEGYRCIFIDYTLTKNVVVNHSLIIAASYDQCKRYLEGKVVFYYNSPATVKELHRYRFDHVIFELVDNPVEEFNEWAKDMDEAIKKADAVSTTSKVMEHIVSKYTSNYRIIPNGADYKHFKRAEERLPKPRDFPHVVNKQVVGYYGAHAPWVDWELIEKIANLDFVHVVMIGKMEKVYNLSFNHKNITWLPIKQYSELPNYLSWFDVCIIPFKLTEMIKGCDPIKFYEYSSAGKPVVATKMEELTKFGENVYFMDHTNYEEVIRRAIVESKNRGKILRRQKIARLNSWGKRANRLLELI